MRKVKLIRALALVLIMGLTLWPASVQFSRIITGQGSTGVGENRALKDWPKWVETDNNLANYTASISDFLNDHFGGRAQAIRIRNKLFRLIGDTSVSVLKGRTQGWYFLNDGTLWESHTGRLTFSDNDIEAWLSSLEQMQQTANNNGAVYAAIIPPDKASVYAENVPERFTAALDSRFVKALYQHPRSAALGLINPEPAMLRAKDRGPVYTKTDTHWTTRGAFEAYTGVMDYFRSVGLLAPRLERSALGETRREAFSGDLAQLMGLKGSVLEDFIDVTASSPTTDFTVTIVKDNSVVNSDWQTRIYQNEVSMGKTLVIVGDSFSNVLTPLFKHSFDRIILVHHRMGNFDMETAMSYAPDAVLFAPVERTAVTMREFAKP